MYNKVDRNTKKFAFRFGRFKDSFYICREH